MPLGLFVKKNLRESGNLVENAVDVKKILK